MLHCHQESLCEKSTSERHWRSERSPQKSCLAASTSGLHGGVACRKALLKQLTWHLDWCLPADVWGRRYKEASIIQWHPAGAFWLSHSTVLCEPHTLSISTVQRWCFSNLQQDANGRGLHSCRSICKGPAEWEFWKQQQQHCDMDDLRFRWVWIKTLWPDFTELLSQLNSKLTWHG